MAITVEARKVTVSAGFKTLLAGVSFRAAPGEVLGILGPSGAGKSTLFRALNGTSSPDGGQVLYGGDDLYQNLDRYRAQIGHVPQDDILHASLTPRSVLYYTGKLRMPPTVTEEEVERRVEQVLALVGLEERADVRVRSLSGGQRKRVNIGVELMTSPPVLFLDEPTSGLDPALEAKMMELFQRLARDGRTLFVTTHVTESLELVDRVLILCSGKLVFSGRPRSALQFFEVTEFTDIYSRLTSKGADHWAGLFASRGPADEPAAVVAPAMATARLTEAQRKNASADQLLAMLELELEREKGKRG